MIDEKAPAHVPNEESDPNGDIKGQIAGVLGQIGTLLGIGGKDGETNTTLKDLIGEVLHGDKKTPGILPKVDKISSEVAKAFNELDVVRAQNHRQDMRMSQLEGRVAGLNAEIAGLRGAIAGLSAKNNLDRNSAAAESDRRNIGGTKKNEPG